MRKKYLFLLIVILFFLFPSNSFGFENSKLVEIAKKYEGKNVGVECKGFVQKVVKEAGGKLGPGYRYCYLDIGKEITAEEATAGDIIQLDAPKNDDDEKYDRKGGKSAYTYPMHTAIVIENLGDGKYKVIDSNIKLDKIVRIHTFNPWTLAGNKLHVHFYRLGDISASPVNPPDYSDKPNTPQEPGKNLPQPQPPVTKNITVVIEIDNSGSMVTNDPFNIRLLAVKFLLDLLPNGTKVCVCSYGDEITMFQSMAILTAENREKIKNSITLSSDEATNMDLAFNEAYDQLSSDKSINSKYVIILTDGRHDTGIGFFEGQPYKNSHLKLWEKDWKIYGVFLCSNPVNPTVSDIGEVPDPGFLKSVTGEEKGKGKFFNAPSPQNLQTIYSEISKQVQGQKVVFEPKPFSLKPNEEKTLNFLLPEKSTSMQVLTNWAGSSVSTKISADGYELNGPNYQVINIDDVRKLRGKKVEVKVKAVDVPPQGEEINLTVRAKVDEVLPELKAKIPFYSRNLKVSARASDNIRIKEIKVYYLDDGKWILKVSRKSDKISYQGKISDGLYPVKVEAVDEVGNKSAVFTNTTIDSKKPRIFISQKNPSWFKDAAIKVKVTDSNLKSLDIKCGQKEIKSEDGQAQIKPKIGDRVVIKAKDRIGNRETKIIKVDGSFWRMLWESVLDLFRIIAEKI